MSRASNLAGFSTSISPPTNLSVGIVTATSFVGNGSGLTGVGIGSTGNINTTGIITATSFSGSGANLTGVGIGTNGSVNTTGIITATTFVGALTGTATTTTNIPNLTGAITSVGTATTLGSFTSLQLLTALTDETGTGSNVFSTSPTLTDPSIVGTILEDIFTITDAAAFEVDPGNGSIQLITLGASRTPKCTNMVAGESVTLMVDDGTAYTITWTDATWGTGGVVWKTNAGAAPTLNTSGYTVIVLWKVSTQVYGARVGDA